MRIKFDQILGVVTEFFAGQNDLLRNLTWLVVNRDLYGRVRLIAPDYIEGQEYHNALKNMAGTLAERLFPHAYSADTMILYEPAWEPVCQGASTFPLEGYDNVICADRLATEGDWAHVADEAAGAPRIVFFSIKGGVGRSTTLAAVAWQLAQTGKRVLVLDLDLESPGLSSSLLPAERQPKYGIVDWLVEDLVGSADAMLDSMYAISDLSHDGEIYVVPAHGKNPGEYVSKLGRVWMPKMDEEDRHESWSVRLQRLLGKLEEDHHPDVVLIDSRAGIDEIASTCVTDLGAKLVLLFALEGIQTWTGYRILFEHWRQRNVAEEIRERLQLVGAMVPEVNRADYQENLRDHAYDLFAGSLYDDIKAGEVGEGWHFEPADENAPHYPWGVKWHRNFAGLHSLQGHLAAIDIQEVNNLFGPVIEGIAASIKGGELDV
jgi:CO dehydrogenase nickel-insertion accessory protein CooC1